VPGFIGFVIRVLRRVLTGFELFCRRRELTKEGYCLQVGRVFIRPC